MSASEAAANEKKTVTELKRPAQADQTAPAAISDSAAETPGDRNTVFGSLVTEDNDVVGLVAYSIYKQNKHDFLVAFSRAKGREPNEVEMGAYTMGESTPRRLAIYRHLAQATLDGRGPESPAIPGGAVRKAQPANSSALNTKLLLALIVLAGATLAYLLARFGLPGAG